MKVKTAFRKLGTWINEGYLDVELDGDPKAVEGVLKVIRAWMKTYSKDEIGGMWEEKNP